MKLDKIKIYKEQLQNKVRHDGEDMYFYDEQKAVWKCYTGHLAVMEVKKILEVSAGTRNISGPEAKTLLADLICDPQFYKPLTAQPTYLFNCKNGVFNLSGKKISEPLSDFKFQLDFKYLEEATPAQCKVFSEFLSTAFNINHKDDYSELFKCNSVVRLMEMIGYMVSNEYRAKKLLVILGPANSGKSQLLELLRKVIGEENTVALTLDDLSGQGHSRFRTELLQKAHALINDELPTKGLKNLAELKKIIAGESITVEAKGARPKTIKNHTKLIFAGNQLPELDEPDCGNAFADRICLVAFKQSIPADKKDVDLLDKLYAERDAIFSLALNYYNKMRKNNLTFTSDKAAEEILQAYKDDNASVITFIRDRDFIEQGPDKKVHTNTLFEHYQAYCDGASLNPVKSLKSFRQQLLSLPEIAGIRKQRLAGDKNPCSVVLGVSLVS